MYHNNEISIINLSRLQCIVSVLASVLANNFNTNTRIGNIGKKWYRSISNRKLYVAQYNESKCIVSLNWLGIKVIGKLLSHDTAQAICELNPEWCLCTPTLKWYISVLQLPVFALS